MPERNLALSCKETQQLTFHAIWPTASQWKIKCGGYQSTHALITQRKKEINKTMLDNVSMLNSKAALMNHLSSAFYVELLKRVHERWWWYNNTLTMYVVSDHVCFTYLFAYLNVCPHVALYKGWGVLLRWDVCVGPVYSQRHQRNRGHHLSGSEWLQVGPLLCLSTGWASALTPSETDLDMTYKKIDLLNLSQLMSYSTYIHRVQIHAVVYGVSFNPKP